MSRVVNLSCLEILFVQLVISVVYAQNLQCDNNEAGCLQALRDTLTRTDLWFGDSYSTACQNVTDKKFACWNPDRDHKTIISRVLQVPNFNVSNIKRLLHIRFYVPAGSYRACGHTFNVRSTYMSKDLQLSDISTLDSWTMQSRPAITWDPEAGALYTLAAYNVDLVQLVGLWINIQGGDSALGKELVPYSGPLAALNRTSFHAFMLFRQNEFISDRQFDTSKESIKSGESKDMFSMSDLEALLGQRVEPIGTGLISAGSDPYGIERHKTLSLYNNCPWLIARMRPLLKNVLDVHNLTALGAEASDLEVEVEVRYTSEALTFNSCCKSIVENARTFLIDPLNQKPVSPVHLRSQPFVNFVAVNMMDTIFFLNKLYTILFLDVTWATAKPGQRQTTLLWHVTDIPGQYVTSGLTQKEYVMPQPPLDRSSSLYTFFVFRQKSRFVNYTTEKYCNTRDGNCDFNLHKFVLENKLHLSGINWLWSQADLYSRTKIYETDVTKMDTACKGLSFYGHPCPDKCAPQTTTKSTAPTNTITVTKRTGGGCNGLSVNKGLALLVPVLILVKSVGDMRR